MTVSFFPHDQKFWLDHGLFMIFLAATQMIIIVPLFEYAQFLFFCDLFWFPFFTFAVLLFRYMFKSFEWNSLSSRQFVEYSLVFSLSSGLAVAVIMSAIFSSFFWSEIITDILPNNKNHLSLAKLIMGSIMGNWIQTTIFIAAWIFLYNSITSNKRISDAELRYFRAQHALKEATLNSLSNQLNPHFLFNALNNIRFMIHENQQSADRMITSLSDILRYSLESARQEKVRLEEELRVIQEYIAIMKSQLEDRLHFELSIPDELKDYLIPPMTLQMLTENGIKHGIDHMKQGGALILSGTYDDRNIFFEVINDISTTQPKSFANTGIGLKNIKHRLEILYGDKAELSLSSTPYKFTVKLRIPKELS
jgi:sensor histidine kinase YesM